MLFLCVILWFCWLLFKIKNKSMGHFGVLWKRKKTTYHQQVRPRNSQLQLIGYIMIMNDNWMGLKRNETERQKVTKIKLKSMSMRVCKLKIKNNIQRFLVDSSTLFLRHPSLVRLVFLRGLYFFMLLSFTVGRVDSQWPNEKRRNSS